MIETYSTEADILGRKLPGPAPDEPIHVKLKRVVDSRKGYRTYTEVAAIAGMDKRVLSRVLNGSVPNPRILTIVAILRAVGADLADLQRA